MAEEYLAPEVIELGPADELVRFVKVELIECDDAAFYCGGNCGQGQGC